jgi:LmbE family N-acetylglucosaminyl deacetylase
VVRTFGPDGIFGHPDHIAVGAAASAVFLRYAASSGTGFRRLLHAAIPKTVFERWNHQRAQLNLPVFDPTAMYHMRGVPDEEIGLMVDCRPVAGKIVAGLQEHRSQHHVMSDDSADTTRWKRVVSREWHVVAWPPRLPPHHCSLTSSMACPRPTPAAVRRGRGCSTEVGVDGPPPGGGRCASR